MNETVADGIGAGLTVGGIVKVALPGGREVQKSACYQEFLIRLANCEHCEHCEHWKSGKVERWKSGNEEIVPK